jgi:simple sugar transport system ATP-binding protein
VGITGVSGNGQLELIQAIFGLARADAGSVKVAGKDLTNQKVSRIRHSGVALIPEDRYLTGSAREANLTENALMGSETDTFFARNGIINWQRAQTYTKELIADFNVKASGPDQKMSELSGGNAQKLIVAREMFMDISLLIAYEPTRGIDIGAIEFIHDKIIEKRNAGDGILLISSELTEIMSLSDRIYVIHDGEIVGEFQKGQVDDVKLGLLMVGGWKREIVKKTVDQGCCIS